MKSLLIKNCSYIITQDEERRVLKDSSILIEGGLITEVSRRNLEAEVKIDGEGVAALPGLINAHTHAAMSLLRGYADDLPLKQWLEQKIWPLERKLIYDYCLQGALLACLELTKTGTTYFLDMYFYPEATAQAASLIGLKAFVAYGMLDFRDPYIGEEQIKVAKRFLERSLELRKKGIVPALGPHAPYTCSDELLIGASELAKRYGTILHIHLAETPEEVKAFKAEKGVSEVKYLDRLGVLGSHVVAAHCVWISDRDIEVLARRDVKVVHCPISNLKLASGIAPIPKLLKAGVTVALGTDGAASNNSLSVFSSMKLSALIHKVSHMDPTVMPAQAVFDMATIDGARALGLNAGKLVEGASADLCLLSLKKFNFTPIHTPNSLISHMVYANENAEVDTLIVGGKPVILNGKLTLMKEAEILSKAEEAARRLVEA